MKENPYDKPMKLMETTQQLLKESDKTLLGIYTETGLPYYWLKKFSAGDFDNPSVNRVQFLYEFLTQSELLVEAE